MNCIRCRTRQCRDIEQETARSRGSTNHSRFPGANNASSCRVSGQTRRHCPYALHCYHEERSGDDKTPVKRLPVTRGSERNQRESSELFPSSSFFLSPPLVHLLLLLPLASWQGRTHHRRDSEPQSTPAARQPQAEAPAASPYEVPSVSVERRASRAPLPHSAPPPQSSGAVRCVGGASPQRQRLAAARVATTSAVAACQVGKFVWC